MTKADPSNRRAAALPLALLLRQLHSYLAVFVAPSVLFFAVTGGLQVYSLHEAHGDYTPPPILEKLAAVHKDQVFEAPHHRPPPPASAKPAKAEAEPPKPLSVQVLKAFFLIVAISLTASTGLGLWMAVKFVRNKLLCAVLFAAGVLVPLLSFGLG